MPSRCSVYRMESSDLLPQNTLAGILNISKRYNPGRNRLQIVSAILRGALR